MARGTNPHFMAGVPELMILRLLHDHDMYAYQLVQAIRVETRNVVNLGEGVVYRLVHTLEREGALRSRRKAVEGRTRIYYAVTTVGQRRYGALAKNWLTLAGAIRSVIERMRGA